MEFHYERLLHIKIFNLAVNMKNKNSLRVKLGENPPIISKDTGRRMGGAS
jgi:hypothetical protein